MKHLWYVVLRNDDGRQIPIVVESESDEWWNVFTAINEQRLEMALWFGWQVLVIDRYDNVDFG